MSTKIAISLFPDDFSNCLVYQTKDYEILFFNGFLFFQAYRFAHICTGSKLSEVEGKIDFLMGVDIFFSFSVLRYHDVACTGCNADAPGTKLTTSYVDYLLPVLT